MSSTNRGATRHKSDYYVTPQCYVRTALGCFLQDEKIDRPDKLFWLDPCAGGDADTAMAYPAVLEEEFAAIVLTLDIRPDSPAHVCSDYRQLHLSSLNAPPPDVVITNPPFNIAAEIIDKALADVKDGGYVIMLLRLNFLGSQVRNKPGAFWTRNEACLKRVYVHPDRISFTGEKSGVTSRAGKTDSIEYAHFVFQKGYDGPTTMEIAPYSRPDLLHFNEG